MTSSTGPRNWRLAICVTTFVCGLGATLAGAACHVGNDVEFPAASTHGANYLLGSPLSLSSTATITHLPLISKSSGQHVGMARYTVIARQPGNPVTSTRSTLGTTGVMEIGAPAATVPAGSYWIMGIFDTLASVGIDFTPTNVVMYTSLTYGSPLPNPFPPPATYSGQQ